MNRKNVSILIVFLILVSIANAGLEPVQNMNLITNDAITPGTANAGMTTIGDTIYFSAANSTSNSQIYSYDGSTVNLLGTHNTLVPNNYVNLSDVIYFIYDDAVGSGPELWEVKNGVVSITNDFFPNPPQGSVYGIPIAYDGKIFYNGKNTTSGYELWSYNGTDPVLEAEIVSGSGSSVISSFVIYNNKLFFRAGDASSDYELYSFDGTTLTKETDVSGSLTFDEPIVYNGKIYFIGSNTTYGSEIFSFDGTSIENAADIYTGSSGSSPEGLTVYSDTLFFSADDSSTYGNELWYINSSGVGVIDIVAGTGSSDPTEFALTADKLYFSSSLGYHEYDGSTVSTPFTLPDFGVSAIYKMTGLGDNLMFHGSSDVYGTELFLYNGSSINLVEDINDLELSSNPANFISFDGKLYFTADNGTGITLWETTDGNTISPATGITPGSITSPDNFIEYDSKIYFSAANATVGTELWSYDGSDLVLAADINPGASSSSPNYLTVYDNEIIFAANNGINGTEVWSYDGNTATLVADVYPGNNGDPREFTEYKGVLYFSSQYEFAHGNEFFSYDGTSVTLIADIDTRTHLSGFPSDFKVYNDILYFRATNSTVGAELFSYNGSSLSVAADIAPGAGSSTPYDITLYNNKLYFNANNGSTGAELYSYDGSTVSLVSDINSGSSASNPNYFEVFDDSLYFTADDGSTGAELYVYDGSTVSLAVDVRQGSATPGITELYGFNNTLYFGGDTESQGRELYKFIPPPPTYVFSNVTTLDSDLELVDESENEITEGGDSNVSSTFFIRGQSKDNIVKLVANTTAVSLGSLVVQAKPGKAFVKNIETTSGITSVGMYALFSGSKPVESVFICHGAESLDVSETTCEYDGGTLYTWDTATESGVKKGGMTFTLDSANQRYGFDNITGTNGGESGGPFTTSTLTCNIMNWTDIDGGNDNTNTSNSIYTWYINDENASTYQVIGGQTAINLSSANFDAEDCIICQVEALDVHGFGNLTLNSSEVCIQNKAPNQPTNNKVKDGATSWDGTTKDTHDLLADLNWSVIDNDDNTVLTHICVANSTDNRNESNCLYSTSTALGTFTVSDITGLYYSGTSITYYVRLTPNDGTVNGTWLDFDFDLINSMPNTPTSLDTTTTHDNTPTVAWTATDDDDGTDNHWPADSLTYHIVIEDTVNATIYSSSNSADKAGYTSDVLPWGTPNGAYANRTLSATIYTTDGNTDGLSANYTPDFVLYDFLPTVTDVSLTDSGTYSSCTGSTCALTPVSGTNTSLSVKLVATDLDGDCDLTSSAHFYLCLNTTDCNSDIGNYSWAVDSIDMVGNDCTYTFIANKTSTDGTPEFWRLANTYKFYSLISSQGGSRVSDTNAEGDWIYNTLSSINYSTTVYLGDGTLTLGQWNNGTSKAIVTNFGNNILDLQWQSTDPTSGVDTWNLNGSDLYIDDDLNVHDDSDNILRTVMNGSDDYFNPASGLQLCLENTCNVSLLNETMDTYYHAYPPNGLTAGTYNSTITITLGTH